MKIKHIVMTKECVVPDDMDNTILNDDCLQKRMKFLSENLISTLNNQTNLNFDFLVLANENHTQNQLDMMRSAVQRGNRKFRFKVLTYGEQYFNYL